MLGLALSAAPAAAVRDGSSSRHAAPVEASTSPGAAAPSGTLRWTRPALSDPITITIPTRGQEEYRLEAGRDYRLQFENGLRSGPLRIYGGRNVVLVGGEHVIEDTVYERYYDHLLFLFRDQTGTIHIEGYHGHGPGATEGFNVWIPDAVFQLQNSRVEIQRMHPDGEPEHPDIIKTWSGPREMRIWNFSGASDWQGFLFMRDAGAGGVYPGRVIMDRVNMWPQPNPAWDGKGWGVSHIWMLSAQTEFRLGAIWLETGWWKGTYRKGLKDSLGYRDPDVSAPLWAWREFRSSGRPYRPAHIGWPASRGVSKARKQGDSIVFVRARHDNIWNLRRTGRARIFQGRPPGGDYAPVESVGRAYAVAPTR